MRLNPDPILPREGAPGFTQTLLLKLNTLFRNIHYQLNCLTEGRIECVTNAQTTAPTTGKYVQGDFVRNLTPSELGAASSKYVVTGWLCTVSGDPATFVECRCLTGN